MIQNLVYNLCESFIENVDGILGVGKKSTPITYLTQWKIVGNSIVHGNEIWSCGEYNPTDGKYHILVQPLGGSIADIALDEPLRKIEKKIFLNETFNVRPSTEVGVILEYLGNETCTFTITGTSPQAFQIYGQNKKTGSLISLISESEVVTLPFSFENPRPDLELINISLRIFSKATAGTINIEILKTLSSPVADIIEFVNGVATLTRAVKEMNGKLYVLDTPTTETIQVPQIQEADTYTCVISQGGKAVEWF